MFGGIRLVWMDRGEILSVFNGNNKLLLLTITSLESFKEIREFAANRFSDRDAEEVEYGHTEILGISGNVNNLQRGQTCTCMSKPREPKFLVKWDTPVGL